MRADVVMSASASHMYTLLKYNYVLPSVDFLFF